MAKAVWIIVFCFEIIKLTLCTRHPGFVGKDLLKKFLNPDNFHQYKPHGHHVLRYTENEHEDPQLASLENLFRRQRTSSNVTTPQPAKPAMLHRLRKDNANLNIHIKKRPTQIKLRSALNKAKKSVIYPYFRLQNYIHSNASRPLLPITTENPPIPKEILNYNETLKQNDTKSNSVKEKKLCSRRKSNKDTKVTFNDIMAKDVDDSEQLTEAPEICLTVKPVKTEAHTEAVKHIIKNKIKAIKVISPKLVKIQDTTTIKPIKNKIADIKVDNENLDDEIQFSDIMGDFKRAIIEPEPSTAYSIEIGKDSMSKELDTKEESSAAEEPEDAQMGFPEPPDYVLAL